MFGGFTGRWLSLAWNSPGTASRIREMVFKEDMPGIRKAVFMAAKAAARGYLATKGVPLP